MKEKIMLISQHPDITVPFKTALEENGYSVTVNSIFYQRGRKPKSDNFDLVVMFLTVNRNSRENIGEESLTVNALFVLMNKTSSNAIQTYSNGLYTFSGQRNDTRKFIRTVNSLLENRYHPREIFSQYNKEYNGNLKIPIIDDIIGQSPQIVELRESVRKIYKQPDLPVLMTGETGTGKELVANILHHSSSRADKPFIEINCSAIPENLLESQLFGHKKGAFTGASTDHQGLFKKADGGTILLDEIGEMSLKLQPKILRFIESQCFYRVGSTRETKVNVWVLTSTNASLPDLIEKKLFRLDLFYRLNVLRIKLPPLWERKQDIPLLIKEFLRQEGADSLTFSPEVMRRVISYNWPGNVRELRNFVRCLSLKMKSGLVIPEDLPGELRKNVNEKMYNYKIITLADMEREHIIKTFQENYCRIRKTARLLGIARNTLRKKLDDYGILIDSNA